MSLPLPDVDATLAALDRVDYLAERETAVVTWLAFALGKPILVEGPPGVGKTELAKAVAAATERPLLRLQCYEGIDEPRVLYEWAYGKQMLYTQLAREALGRTVEGAATLAEAVDRIAAEESAFFDPRFLIERPLLAALRAPSPVVLLIDEIDRADAEVEALLLEVLGELQITIPELGTIKARHRPFVLLTSNATREMSEALRRRCLHLHLDHPSAIRELRIVRRRVPEAQEALLRSLVALCRAVRELDLRKVPSVAETVEWARAMVLLGADSLEPELVRQTLGVLLKHEDDRAEVRGELHRLLPRALDT